MGFFEILIRGSHIGILIFWAVMSLSIIVNTAVGEIDWQDGLKNIAVAMVIVAASMFIFKEYTNRRSSIDTVGLMRFSIVFIALDILSLVKEGIDGGSST